MSKTTKSKYIDVKLTRGDLEHIRDLMSIMLSNSRSKTLSVMLSEHKGQTEKENLLWKRILSACKKAEIPVGEYAPDYLISIVNSPEFAISTVSTTSETEDI